MGQKVHYIATLITFKQLYMTIGTALEEINCGDSSRGT